jgi:hypothetical protein
MVIYYKMSTGHKIPGTNIVSLPGGGTGRVIPGTNIVNLPTPPSQNILRPFRPK